jgi:uncharacterized phiE125 gp8 family phage protein
LPSLQSDTKRHRHNKIKYSVAYKVTTAPTTEPLTRSEVKNYLKVDSTSDDALIDTLITAARQWVENHCALALLPQTVLEVFDGLPQGGTLNLRISPLREVSGLHYLDSAGAVQVMASGIYRVDTVTMPPRIIRKYDQTWPDTQNTPGNASAIYTAGYDNSSAVPAAIKTAMLLTIADMYDNRTDYVKKMPTAAEYILQAAGYRIFVWS